MIGTLAERQWGVVARRQLVRGGVTESMILRRVGSGRLVPLHRGVYAVGHRQLRREAVWLAAVLAVPRGVLSYRDAAGLHGLRAANHARIAVSTPGRGRLVDAGIDIHRTSILDAEDVTTVSGIPVTSVARTLVDLAGVVPRDHLANAFRRAEELRVLDVRAVRRALARTRHRRGPGHDAACQALAELEAMATTLTSSSLEARFQRLVRQARLPQSRTNVHIDGYEVDVCWPHARLVVELDGWEFHHAKHAFQRDRERDAKLARSGWTVVRFTHHDVVRRPAWVVDTVRDLLAQGRGSAPSAVRATMSDPCL